MRDDDILTVTQKFRARLRKTSATEFDGTCLVCGAPGFTINTATQTWRCRSCDIGGDAIALTRRVLHCELADAVEFVSGNWPWKQAWPSPTRPRRRRRWVMLK